MHLEIFVSGCSNTDDFLTIGTLQSAATSELHCNSVVPSCYVRKLYLILRALTQVS